MNNFDIGTLLNFKPPRFLCERCKALLDTLIWSKSGKHLYCPICKVEYVKGIHDIYDYLPHFDELGYLLTYDDPIAHGQRLAAIAYNFSQERESYPPLRALLEAISSAKHFVHFTTFGLSHMIFGALKLKAQAIAVRGIASNIHPEFTPEIAEYHFEHVNLEIKVFERNREPNDWAYVPHQKLMVVDGLMAFKGAANMTQEAWRKVATGHDHIEIVTNIEEVAKLHNKLFSALWASFDDRTEIPLNGGIPF